MATTRVQLQAEFDELHAALNRRGWSDSALSRHFDYSGKNGPRDLGKVREGVSTKTTLPRAITSFRRLLPVDVWQAIQRRHMPPAPADDDDEEDDYEAGDGAAAAEPPQQRERERRDGSVPRVARDDPRPGNAPDRFVASDAADSPTSPAAPVHRDSADIAPDATPNDAGTPVSEALRMNVDWELSRIQHDGWRFLGAHFAEQLLVSPSDAKRQAAVDFGRKQLAGYSVAAVALNDKKQFVCMHVVHTAVSVKVHVDSSAAPAVDLAQRFGELFAEWNRMTVTPTVETTVEAARREADTEIAVIHFTKVVRTASATQGDAAATA